MHIFVNCLIHWRPLKLACPHMHNSTDGSECLLWGRNANSRLWHKVSSSQSTTKQAFSIGGIYDVTVRFSLEPDRPFLGLSRRWRFSERGVGSACRNVRFKIFRIVTFDTLPPFDFIEMRYSTFRFSDDTYTTKNVIFRATKKPDHVRLSRYQAGLELE